ncbi:protein of unknown function [Aminobacter niigataensis]|nr:protein of unknown function [Aminobacter niigataensis]
MEDEGKAQRLVGRQQRILADNRNARRIGVIERAEFQPGEIADADAAPLIFRQKPVGEAKGPKALAEGVEEFARLARIAHRLAGERLHRRQRVLDPMVDLAQQQALALLGVAALGDVVVDAKHQCRPAFGVALDDAAAGRQPAWRMGTLDAVFAGIVVAAFERFAEHLARLVDVAPVDGNDDVARPHSCGRGHVEELGQERIAFDDAGARIPDPACQRCRLQRHGTAGFGMHQGGLGPCAGQGAVAQHDQACCERGERLQLPELCRVGRRALLAVEHHERSDLTARHDDRHGEVEGKGGCRRTGLGGNGCGRLVGVDAEMRVEGQHAGLIGESKHGCGRVKERCGKARQPVEICVARRLERAADARVALSVVDHISFDAFVVLHDRPLASTEPKRVRPA